MQECVPQAKALLEKLDGNHHMLLQPGYGNSAAAPGTMQAVPTNRGRRGSSADTVAASNGSVGSGSGQLSAYGGGAAGGGSGGGPRKSQMQAPGASQQQLLQQQQHQQQYRQQQHHQQHQTRAAARSQQAQGRPQNSVPQYVQHSPELMKMLQQQQQQLLLQEQGLAQDQKGGSLQPRRQQRKKQLPPQQQEQLQNQLQQQAQHQQQMMEHQQMMQQQMIQRQTTQRPQRQQPGGKKRQRRQPAPNKPTTVKLEAGAASLSSGLPASDTGDDAGGVNMLGPRQGSLDVLGDIAAAHGEATVMLLKAVITAFPSVSLPFLAVPLRSQPTVAIRPSRSECCDRVNRSTAKPGPCAWSDGVPRPHVVHRFGRQLVVNQVGGVIEGRLRSWPAKFPAPIGGLGGRSDV
eukprot:SAG22_NODE_511_length_9594_cov_4.553449_2_plen_404_part_00